jgi:superfamily II DNA or RNA helicase
MSFFDQHYSEFKYPRQNAEGEPGFRPAQLGAVHAAAAHFEMRSDPGIITMPTGSGKIAVLIASAFVLQAQRVLILVPSRLVREQIADEVTTLATLKKMGAVPDGLGEPRVFNTKKRITSEEDWEGLRGYDVVVATIQSVSPGYLGTPEPPDDLFDLVLVDEAHHSPARTWESLLKHFKNSKQLLFTATPFRQDQREIKGRFIYTYDLKRAYDDGVFGQINFEPVTNRDQANSDVAIAIAAQEKFRADQEQGFDHRLMVRTDSLKRAQELVTIYEENTDLRLKVVSGNKSLGVVKAIIQNLEDGDLDGIICVNMLGEGFNFPSLKIAAIHSPHKSLNVTLQFIGRFARTVGEDLGPATFLAVPSEIEIEAERLYDSRSVWQDIVQNLSAARVNQEAEIRDVLDSFELTDYSNGDLSDLSLYILEPYFHVKVMQLNQAVELQEHIKIPAAFEIVFETLSEQHNALVFITREISQPRWAADDRLAGVRHDLFVFFQDPITNLLFMCSSRRTEGVYHQVSESVDFADPKPLHLSRLNKAMNELQAPEFFNVGMRNRVASNTTESYRIVAGSSADKAIQKSDGRLYHRGHVFGRASDNGELVTIGISSASKIWSNRSGKLPELIKWCETIARRINSDAAPATGSGLDHLDMGEEISELPEGIISVDWPAVAFQKSIQFAFELDGTISTVSIFDCDIQLIEDQINDGKVAIRVSSDTGLCYEFTYSFETDKLFEPLNGEQPEVSVISDSEKLPILDYFNVQYPEFYTSDLARVYGFSILREKEGAFDPLDLTQLETKDWNLRNVDIQTEFGPVNNDRLSIQDGLAKELATGNDSVVFCDHGTGEMADFICIEQLEHRLLVRLYHCKSSGGAAAGHRVNDVYEVASQAVKSIKWAKKQAVLKQVRYRFQNQKGVANFIKGDLGTLEDLLNAATPAQIDFEMIVVQPGIQKEGLPEDLQNNLASATDFIERAGFKPLVVWCSD